ncbi:MAG: hypothetical protein DRI44_02330 [Chlamydiae bacterium]|nr:MAG: hypothetical protein DRI44_02330 [Chlamydiota bacterium]
MKIDLEKELGLNQASNSNKFPWLKVIIFLCAANLLLLIILLFTSKQNLPASVNDSSFIAMNSQFIADVSARLTNIERLQKLLQITQKKAKKEFSIVSADKKIQDKKERMKQKKLKKSGLTDKEINSLDSSLQNNGSVGNITDEEKNNLDDLIDRDESGAQLLAYIRALPSANHKKAVIQYLRQKGEQWYKATLPLLADDDPDADLYVNNTRYFFEIIRDVSDNSAAIAYAGSKLNQLELAVQKNEFKRITENESLNRQNEISKLKDDLAHEETPEQAQTRIQRDRRRNSIIKPYTSSKLTHPYKSDWDPDPRVREKQGIK